MRASVNSSYVRLVSGMLLWLIVLLAFLPPAEAGINGVTPIGKNLCAAGCGPGDTFVSKWFNMDAYLFIQGCLDFTDPAGKELKFIYIKADLFTTQGPYFLTAGQCAGQLLGFFAGGESGNWRLDVNNRNPVPVVFTGNIYWRIDPPPPRGQP